MPNDAPEPPEIIEVDKTTVACDGGGGVLGHPRVFSCLGDPCYRPAFDYGGP